MTLNTTTTTTDTTENADYTTFALLQTFIESTEAALTRGVTLTRQEMLGVALAHPLLKTWHDGELGDVHCLADAEGFQTMFSVFLKPLLLRQSGGDGVPDFVPYGDLKAPTFIHRDCFLTIEQAESAIAIQRYYADLQVPPAVIAALGIGDVIGLCDGDLHAEEYIECLNDAEELEEARSPLPRAA